MNNIKEIILSDAIDKALKLNKKVIILKRIVAVLFAIIACLVGWIWKKNWSNVFGIVETIK